MIESLLGAGGAIALGGGESRGATIVVFGRREGSNDRGGCGG